MVDGKRTLVEQYRSEKWFGLNTLYTSEPGACNVCQRITYRICLKTGLYVCHNQCCINSAEGNGGEPVPNWP